MKWSPWARSRTLMASAVRLSIVNSSAMVTFPPAHCGAIGLAKAITALSWRGIKSGPAGGDPDEAASRAAPGTRGASGEVHGGGKLAQRSPDRDFLTRDYLWWDHDRGS